MESSLEEGKINKEGWIEVELKEDYMRGGKEGLVIRLRPEDQIELPCDCNYYGNEGLPGVVKIISRIEAKKGDLWEPYPVVSWQDSDSQLETLIFVVMRNRDVIIMSSPNGVPDGRLYSAAEAKGLLVKNAS